MPAAILATSRAVLECILIPIDLLQPRFANEARVNQYIDLLAVIE